MTMNWTCEKCATRHETDAERTTCRRSERRITVVAVVAISILIVIIGGIEFAWHQYAYGDWKCALIECRKVVP